jgi:hypothetical protein
VGAKAVKACRDDSGTPITFLPFALVDKDFTLFEVDVTGRTMVSVSPYPPIHRRAFLVDCRDGETLTMC